MKDLENLNLIDINFGVTYSNSATYSQSTYEKFNKSGDRNIFEEEIDNNILEKFATEEEKNIINSLPTKNKRLATLMLLDTDKKLWSKLYKSIQGNIIPKMDQIKETILMLREFVKTGDTEKKKFGEVMTPLSLVKDMLNTLPKEVWTNPYLKWLDPANGSGPFPIMVIYKLMKNLKDYKDDKLDLRDENVRYKHIIENMIYTVDIQAKNIFLWLTACDPNDTYLTNIYWGSFLDEKFDKFMKEVWKVDKFDIIIGNPPYQENRSNDNNPTTRDMYPKFVNKSTNFCKYLLMITPSRWFVKGSLRKYRELMINNYGIKKITHFDNNLLFKNADIKGGVSYFLIEIGYKGFVLFNNNYIDLTKYDIIPNDLSSVTFNIINKIKKYENILTLFNSKGHFKIKTNDIRFTDDEKLMKCYVSKQKGSIKYIPIIDVGKINEYKFIIPSASGKGGFNEKFYNRYIIGLPGEVCSESFIFFNFIDEVHLRNFKMYLTSKLFSYLVRLRKIKQDVTSDVFKWVPLIPFDREWNDDMLYKYFKLTEEEIKLIENSSIG